MKCKRIFPPSGGKRLKIVRIMRLSLFFMLAFAFGASASAFSQLQKVTLDLKGTDANTLMREIWKQTGLRFVFNAEELEALPLFDVKATQEEVGNVLTRVFSDTGYACHFEGDVISIRQAPAGTRQQDSRLIRGRVLSADDRSPIVGASVILEGTLTGVATDANGEFRLRVPSGAVVLVVSSIGFESCRLEVTPGMADRVNELLLGRKVSFIDEVIVQGYGTSTVKDATGSVSRLGEKDILMAPTGSSLQSLLQGRSPGVNVTIQSASPTAPVNVVIRGISTITGNSQPLWVIDGVPDYSESTVGSVQNALYNLNIADVESIDILKDASATAIYGSRAANGVIIVTTKKGRQGMAPQVDFSFNTGIQTINSNDIKTMDAEQYKLFMSTVLSQEIERGGSFTYYGRQYFNEAEFNKLRTSQWDASDLVLLDGAFFDGDTDWWDMVTRNASMTQATVSLRGGTEQSNYFTSFGYTDKKGVVKGGSSRLYTGRINFETMLGKELKININLSGSARNTNDKDNTLANIVNFRPDYPAYNEDGSINLVSSNNAVENPLITLANRNNSVGKSFNGTVFAEWAIIPELKLKSAGTLNYSNIQTDLFQKKGTRGLIPAGTNRRTLGSYDNTTYIWDNTLTWMRSFGRHHIVALAGHSVEKFESKRSSMMAGNFPDEEVLIDMGSGSSPSLSSDRQENALVSAIARVNYRFDHRYLATLTFRADGSSKFGSGNRWGYFPSGALAWVISEEEFMKPLNRWVPYLKLRFSMGRTGAQNLGNYDYVSLMGSATYYGQPGMRPSSMGNPLLQWEETTSTDAGLDFGLVEERIRGTIGYYHKKVDNLIYDGSVPGNSSHSTMTQNIGVITNEGWEFDIKADVVRREDMTFTVGFNIATNTGKVKKLDGIVKEIAMPNSSMHYVNLVEGGRIGEWYGYRYAGRYYSSKEEAIALRQPNPASTAGAWTEYFSGYGNAGDLYFLDLDGDGLVAKDKDRTNLGNFNPKFFGGFNFEFRWKNLFASAVFTYSYGAKRLWYDQYNKTFNGIGIYNNYTTLFDSYNFRGLDATYQRLSSAANMVMSDRCLYDASYLRLNTINITYRLPERWLRGSRVASIEVFATAGNVFTRTKYPGFDPEGNFGVPGAGAASSYGVNSANALTVAQGVDYSFYPSARTYNFGVKFSFR